MANASVEKLKALGIRHGEKAVVGLTATAFVVFTAMAITKPTLDMKPDVLKGKAESASSNLQKQQDPKDILAKLERDGLKDPNFQQIVANQISNALKPDDYRVKLDWVTPEPGAGLIRDQPELIAPTELAAFPGRGGIRLFILDDKGERILDTGDAAKKKGAARKGGMSMAGGYPEGPAMGGPPANESPEAKKRREADEEKRKKTFAGKVEPEKEKAAEGPDPAAVGPWKEEIRGKRWIVITGVIDNEKLKKNYLQALKNPAVAYPNYKRLDVEHRTLESDGNWPEWAANDKAHQDKTWDVLDNLPYLDTEYVPESQRPEALVDPLPFLTAGYWTGVHVARLVPAAIRETPKTPPGGPGMPMGGMGGRQGSMGMSGGAMGPGAMPPSGPGGALGGKSMGGMSMSGMAMGGMGMQGGSAGGGGGSEEANFTKHEDPALMLRSLDFSVEPNTSYQFRVRIVVVNPNKDHTDVNPGVDIEADELIGPWSASTDVVTVPADVTAYAQAPEPVSRRDDLVSFQVFKWDTSTGQTVYKTDVSGPGDVVGEFGPVQVPSSEGGGPKSAQIDFNSRALVLDTFGGRQKLPDIGVERNPFEIPAMAMMVEPDGSVVMRTQSRDKSDEVREDMDSNYKKSLEESGKAREEGSGGSRMPGMGGGGGKKKGKGKR